MTVQNRPLPDGYRGTAETIAEMHRLTLDGVKDDRIIRLAREIVYEIPWKEYQSELAAILGWCQQNLRYVRDPVNIERVQHPVVTIFETRSGDCDDLAPAFSALAGAIGNPWRFRTVSVDPFRPNDFVHVYSLAHNGGVWVPADPTFQRAPISWEPQWADLSQRFGVIQSDGVTSRRDWDSA